ncbi:hypothetical protein BG004_007737, partial [Podila humilis]
MTSSPSGFTLMTPEEQSPDITLSGNDTSNVLAASVLPHTENPLIQQSLRLTRSRDEFTVLKELGNGSFGSVFKAQHNASGEMVAIKKMKKKFSSQVGCRSLQEVKILRGLHHMHSHGIMHRDMKPENLLITGDVVKIADFGLAREIKSRPPYTTYVSTRWYRAPEVLLKSSNYTCAVDLWAIGTIAAELMTLKPLFPGSSDMDQMNRISAVLGNPASTLLKASPSYLQDSSSETGIGGEWEDGVNLASRMGVAFDARTLTSLQELIPNGVPTALDFIRGLLRYDPKNRFSAYQSLGCTWFRDMAEAKEIENLTDIPQSPDKRR